MRLIRLLLFAALLLGMSAPAAANDGESERAWFTSEADSALRSYADTSFPNFSKSQREELFVAYPIRLSRLTKELEPQIITWDRWIAPIMLDEDPVGTMLTYREGGDRTIDVSDDVKLAEVLQTLSEGDDVVYDPLLECYFLLHDGALSPASASAADYLAGDVSFPAFLELRSDLLADKPSPAQEVKESSTPVWITGGAIITGLLALIIVIWLRHSPGPASEADPEPRPSRHVRIYRRGDHHGRPRH